MKEKKIVKEVIDAITEHLDYVPNEKLVEIGGILGMSPTEWVDGIPGKPLGFDRFSYEVKSEILDAIYRHIESVVGRKAIWRYQDIEMRGKTEQEFEDFWEREKERKKNIIPQINYLLLIASVLLFSISAVVGLFR